MPTAHDNPMRVLLCWLATLSMTAAASAAATTRATTTTQAGLTAPPRVVMAQGSPADGDRGHVWLVALEQPGIARGGVRSVIMHRDLGSTEGWRGMPPLDLRAVHLAGQGPEPVILFANGRFAWVSGERFTYGPALPGGAAIMAMAGDRQTLWALGVGSPAEPATSAATSPATTAAAKRSGSTYPTTGPAMLFALQRQWTLRHVWAVDQHSLIPGLVSMVVLGQDPVVACATAEGAIHVQRFGQQPQRWLSMDHDRTLRDLKLINAGGAPCLWTLHADGSCQLRLLDSGSPQPIALKLERPLQPGHADLTFGGDELRLIYQADNQLWEQRYSRYDAQPAGGPERLSPSRPAPPPKIDWWTVIGLAVLTFVILGALRKQRSAPGPLPIPAGLTLAPVWRRIVAALIDAVPLLVMLVAIGLRLDVSNIQEMSLENAYLRNWLLIGSGVYLAHTLVAELLTARTLGKWLLGLRVVAFDGTRARPQALVVRNVLRIMDLPLPAPMGLVLDIVIVLYSPYRQRLGDIAGATLVVVNTGPAPEPPEAPPEDSDNE
jgi:uncharacterized RDD family membrane protein YckC